MKHLAIVISAAAALAVGATPDSFQRRPAAARANWGSVYAGRDANGRAEATLENSQIAVRYGYKLSKDSEEGMITRFVFKPRNIDQAGSLLDAAAHRGVPRSADIVSDSGGVKTVRFEWERHANGKFKDRAVADISVYPERPYIRVDHHRFAFAHICDISMPGGRACRSNDARCGGKYAIFGYSSPNPPLYERCFYWDKPGNFGCQPDPDGIGGDPSSLSYRGWYILTVRDPESGVGWGRLVPVAKVQVIKLLWNEGFEIFPKRETPFTTYLFALEGDERAAINIGKRLVDEIIMLDFPVPPPDFSPANAK